MKRVAVLIGVFLALGFAAGFLVARLTTEVVPTMKEQRGHGPTREVPADWRFDKFSPGHSQHVVNRALQCNDCHDPRREGFDEVDIGVCTACHIEQTSHPHLDEKGEITECFTCHAFKYELSLIHI